MTGVSPGSSSLDRQPPHHHGVHAAVKRSSRGPAVSIVSPAGKGFTASLEAGIVGDMLWTLAGSLSAALGGSLAPESRGWLTTVIGPKPAYPPWPHSACPLEGLAGGCAPCDPPHPQRRAVSAGSAVSIVAEAVPVIRH